MFTDYHNHLLPQMDDGSRGFMMSREMLGMLKSQGIERVVATPHYYCHKESVSAFLQRRSQAISKLAPALKEHSLTVSHGAEVYLHKELCDEPALGRLAIRGSRLILLELPYAPYRDWMPAQIAKIAKVHALTPMIAHLDRYTSWYHPKQIDRVLAMPNVVIQINNSALLEEDTLDFALRLIQSGHNVVFGSDTHNLDRRAPNFDAALPILQERLSKDAFTALIEYNRTLIEREALPSNLESVTK